MARFGGLIVAAPVLGSANFPVMSKAGLTAMTAIIITPTLPALAQPLPEAPLALAALAVGELAIGLMIGFVLTLIFAAVQLGGQIMDMQSGFGMMNVFNPALETQFPIFGFFLYIVAVLYLLAFGGHRLMIWALYLTYRDIPVGGFVARPELFREVANWGTAMFVDGVMIAAPVTAAMLLAYVTMGLLGRVIPQIHLFVVGFPLTIATALLLVALLLGIYIQFLDGAFERSFRNVEILIRGMG